MVEHSAAGSHARGGDHHERAGERLHLLRFGNALHFAEREAREARRPPAELGADLLPAFREGLPVGGEGREGHGAVDEDRQLGNAARGREAREVMEHDLGAVHGERRNHARPLPARRCARRRPQAPRRGALRPCGAGRRRSTPRGRRRPRAAAPVRRGTGAPGGRDRRSAPDAAAERRRRSPRGRRRPGCGPRAGSSRAGRTPPPARARRGPDGGARAPRGRPPRDRAEAPARASSSPCGWRSRHPPPGAGRCREAGSRRAPRCRGCSAPRRGTRTSRGPADSPSGRGARGSAPPRRGAPARSGTAPSCAAGAPSRPGRARSRRARASRAPRAGNGSPSRCPSLPETGARESRPQKPNA